MGSLQRYGLSMFALAGLAASLPGQGKDRATVAGQVQRSDGEPVAAAQITLVHRPIGWCAEYGEADVVRVATDAKGRFRAEVMPARPYSVFATWRADDRSFASAVIEHVAAGAFVTLQESASVDATVRVDGQDAWAAVGPFSFRVTPRLANLWQVPLTPAADGTVKLPTLPTTSALLEVVTRDGHTLFSTWVANGERGTTSVKLPPPVALAVRVLDAATGKPVVGAAIEARSSWLGYRVAFPTLDSVEYSRECWRPVGRTDADGRVTVTVPLEAWPPNENTHVSLAVRADNYALAFGGWTHEGAFWEGRAHSEHPDPLQIPLHPQRPVTGRLTLDGTAPAAGVPVILWSEVAVKNKGDNGGSTWDAPVQFATTDEQGVFTFPFAPRGRLPLRVGVALDDAALRQRLTVDGLAPMLLASPFPEAAVHSSSGPDENARELGVASIGVEKRVAVRLIDAQGSPVRGVVVFLLPIKNATGVIAAKNTTDGTGRCQLFPAAADQLLVALAPGLGYVIAPVAGAAEQELRLVAFAAATGRVNQANGEPAAEATLRCSGIRVRYRDGATPQDQAIRSVAERLNHDFAKCTCDREGRFRLPFIPTIDTSLSMSVSLGTGAERQSGKLILECDPKVEQAPFEVRLSR